jgi:ferric-dicitrate binding protein FerR (iron transport regulator)
VNANELKVEVMGTSFNVINFEDDTQSEVVLVTGKVALASENGQTKKELGTMHYGQRAVYEKDQRKVFTQEVDVEKYISWREGKLIFRDDAMEDVVKRLSRWFNVEIAINDPEIKNYIYKATFKNENLTQVLNLLKLSAPIDYRVTSRKVLPDGNFTKQKVFLMKKKS